ncbi:hypothetical protein [Leifsonia shinshuensis]
MSAKPRIVFSTFRSSTDPMFVSYARFNRVVGASARRAASAPSQVMILGGLPATAGDSDREPASAETAAVAPVPAAGSALCGVWRVLASNNRELGRSARAYKSFDAARSHVLSLRDAVDELVTTTVSGTAPGTHGWFMSLRAVPVMTCGRWYGSAASSFEASLALREALRDGELDPVARPVLPVRGGQAAVKELIW